MPEVSVHSRQPVLEARGVGKIFGFSPVFADLNLRVEAGQAVMVMGRNGAGKSTLIETLSGLRRPSAGQALIFGKDAARLGATERARLGVMIHRSLLYQNLTAGENLEFWAELYNVSNPRARAGWLLEALGLGRAADRRVALLSRGMEQRLSLARAMIAGPTLMLFDEPFTALDGEGSALAGGILREATRAGGALVLTAHSPIEIEGLNFELRTLEGGRLAPGKEDKGGGRVRSLFNR